MRKAQSLGFEATMRYMQSYNPLSSVLNAQIYTIRSHQELIKKLMEVKRTRDIPEKSIVVLELSPDDLLNASY